MRPSSFVTGWRTLFFSLAAAILVVGLGTATGGQPPPAKKSLALDGRLMISKTDRCPVCAMFPARHPRAAAAMTLKTQTTYYFCSNGCLLRAFLRPMRYLAVEPITIDRLVVLDYFTGLPIDARSASWVAGSDVFGPMGPAIIALGRPGHASAFIKRHGGDIRFDFDQLDDELWRKISRHKLPEP